MAYSVFAVANAFIKLSKRDGIPVTNMKLQKLVYIAQGFSLAYLPEPLFSNDVRAFKWGPVISELYDAVKHNGSNPITEEISIPESENIDIEDKNNPAMVIINFVWKRYGRYTAAQLSSITHKIGTPWNSVWSTSEYSVIPRDLIRSHYQELSQSASA